MNHWDLKNNAFFLSCWYERTRPVQMICFSILLVSIVALCFLAVRTGLDDMSSKIQSYLNVLVILQSLILLIQGTLFAWSMGVRERTSETENCKLKCDKKRKKKAS